MKKVFVLFSVLLLLVVSCNVAHDLVIDEWNPAENNAQIIFINNNDNGQFIVKEWDGKDIHARLYGGKTVYAVGDSITLTVPSGNHQIIFDTTLYSYNSDEHKYDEFRSSNVAFEYNFVPRRRYQFKGRVVVTQGIIRHTFDLFMGLYDITSGTVLLEERKIPWTLL